MVSQRDKKAINQLKEDIEYFENLSEISSTGDKEQYKKIVNEYKIQPVNISSFDKRNLYDAIRSDWKDISETKIEQIVEEKGFLVGVINKIIHGIVQVEDFEMYPILEEENSPKVDFIGKLISDHPSIHCTLKERTVSGPTQGFNFKEE